MTIGSICLNNIDTNSIEVTTVLKAVSDYFDISEVELQQCIEHYKSHKASIMYDDELCRAKTHKGQCTKTPKAHGFCKTHYEMFVKGTIKLGYFQSKSNNLIALHNSLC
jgi:hypothetical protein